MRWFLLLVVLFLPVASQAGPLDAQRFLAAMRANDTLLDNAELRYVVRGTMQVQPFPTWKFDTRPGVEHSVSARRKPMDVMYHELLAVRGNEITFERKLDASLYPASMRSGMSFPTPYQRWGNAGGKAQELTNQNPSLDVPRGTLLEINPMAGADPLLELQRMEIEFAHGIGFAKRIVSIESAEEIPGGWLIEGTIRVWPGEPARFELRADDNLLVREARVEAQLGQVLNLITSTSRASATGQGIAIAASGSYRHSRHRVAQGLRSDEERVAREFSTEFAALSLGMNDETYRSMTQMAVPAGTHVIDRVRGVEYKSGTLEASSEESALELINNCSECVAGWITVGEILGGGATGECEHGPEHDTDASCPFPSAFSCNELDPVGGNCNCFLCTANPMGTGYSIDCEPEYRVWRASCGFSDCRRKGDECSNALTDPPVIDVVRQTRESSPGLGICDNPFGLFERRIFCGRGDVSAHGCRSNNCQGFGAWGSSETGVREECL